MVVLGRVVAPYGLKGWVHIHPFGDDPAAWGDMPHWWLGAAPEGPSWTPMALKEFRSQGKSLVACFEGISDRSGAESLVGRYIAAPREALPRNADDEYYWSDLIGLAVVNEEGEALGQVKAIIDANANQVLVVADGEQERLLPFVASVVKNVAVTAGRICVAWQKDW